MNQEAKNWQETAAKAQENADFYRGLLLQVAALLGPEVYVSDDGTVQADPLLLKVPELVAKLDKDHTRLRQAFDYGAMSLRSGWQKGRALINKHIDIAFMICIIGACTHSAIRAP